MTTTKITLPYLEREMTVHLDQPRRNGFLCTDANGEDLGVLQKSGWLYTFEDVREYRVPIEVEKATELTPPYAEWWDEKYDPRNQPFDEDDE